MTARPRNEVTASVVAPGMRRLVAVVVAGLLLITGAPSGAVDPNDPSLDPEKGTLEGSPADHLPPYVQQVLPTGMRPD